MDRLHTWFTHPNLISRQTSLLTIHQYAFAYIYLIYTIWFSSESLFIPADVRTLNSVMCITFYIKPTRWTSELNSLFRICIGQYLGPKLQCPLKVKYPLSYVLSFKKTIMFHLYCRPRCVFYHTYCIAPGNLLAFKISW